MYQLWMLKLNFLLARKLVVYLDGNEEKSYILGEICDDGRWWVGNQMVTSDRIGYKPFALDFNLTPFDDLLEALSD